MFSPYYALARARGRGDPADHVAMNVALYGRPHRWAMTERGRDSLHRDADRIEIGASRMRWDGTALAIEVDEVTVPWPSRLRGRVVLCPRILQSRRFDLDGGGRHRWRPFAPLCDVDVQFKQPAIAWSGTGYLDTNDGDEPLEDAFRSWTWSRFDLGDRARIFYDITPREGDRKTLSLAASEDGLVDAAAVPLDTMKATGWRIARTVHCDGTERAVLLQALEDAPFYARSAVRARIDGVEAFGVHETLSLSRLTSPIVRCMLPFKMLRRPSVWSSGAR